MKRKFRQLIIRLRKYLPLNRELRNDYKRILLTIQITLLGLVASFLFTVIDTLHGHYWSAVQDVSAIIAFIFAIYLISKGKFNIGKLIVVLYSCFNMVVNASREGRYAGNQFVWFPIIAGIFLFFSAKEKKFIALCFTVAFISICFLEYTDYSFNLYPNANSNYNYFNYLLCFAIAVTMISLFMVYLIKVNTDSEKKLERLNQTMLIRNENLKKINNELDSFVYKASHDMRAPLTSLLGLIEISKREKDPVALNSFLELQAKSIRKLDGYIVDILNISRNARIEVQEVPINFIEMVEQIYDQLHYIENCFRVKKTITVEGEELFVSDPVRLNIILNNLISNSIRYADLSKEEPLLSIHIKIDREKAIIVIYDNGMGIPEQHLSKVFNMFYRGTETNNGSGLGLYIVKETLNKVKGSIVIKSEYRKYTEVTIVVPNNAGG